jgi:hypothetical protein
LESATISSPDIPVLSPIPTADARLRSRPPPAYVIRTVDS